MLMTLFEAIESLFKAFSKIGELVTTLLDLLFSLLPKVEFLFNPVLLINDIIIGFIMGFALLIKSLLNRLNISRYFGNANKSSSDCSKNNGKSTNGTYCYKTTFLDYIILIACPPLAIFNKYGMQQWFSIVICSILTVFAYYFPGLLYALLMIMH